MAAGTPVIGYRAGGALDYIEPGKTGMFFEEQTVESLAYALQTFDHKHYNAEIVRKQSRSIFARSIWTAHQGTCRQILDIGVINVILLAMCGIVGYIGDRSGTQVVLDGLKALEYRGYDSAGIAVLDKTNKPKLSKTSRPRRRTRETHRQ